MQSPNREGGSRLASVGSIAVGFLAGMLIPATRVENEKIGPTADRLSEVARDTGQEAPDRAQTVAAEVAGTAEEAAQDAMGQVKETAQSSAQEQASEPKDSAQENAQQATRSPQTSTYLSSRRGAGVSPPPHGWTHVRVAA